MISRDNDGYSQGIPAMEEPMRILAIHCSPTMKRGKTYLVLERLLKGAEKAGAITEVVFLQKETIGGCTGCFTCWIKTPGKCIQEDDMAKLIEKRYGIPAAVIEADHTDPRYYNEASVDLKLQALIEIIKERKD